MEDGRAIERNSIDSRLNRHPSDSPSILHPPSSILSSTPAAPRLLVSVRNAAEARAALTGGCDILDVKEPARGALGMADVPAIEQVRTAANQDGRFERCPVTAALGEAREWIEDRAVPAIPAGLWLVKLGLAGLAATDWQTRWREIRSRLDDAPAGVCSGLPWSTRTGDRLRRPRRWPSSKQRSKPGVLAS